MTPNTADVAPRQLREARTVRRAATRNESLEALGNIRSGLHHSNDPFAHGDSTPGLWPLWVKLARVCACVYVLPRSSCVVDGWH